MLSYLHVKNFALINELEIDFDKGLTVLSGETGAGKSIIIGSMNAISGSKLDKGIIRSGGEAYALIEMIFEISEAFAKELTERYDIIFDEEHSLLISRRFNESGRSVYRINSETTTSAVAKAIVEKLIDIHSQHDHQSLLRPNHHITLLDKYIGKDLVPPLKAQLRSLYETYRSHMKQINQDALDDEKRRREIDFLRFEIDEISEANIEVGEDTHLHTEYKVLSNRQKIIENLVGASNILEGDMENSVSSLFGHVMEKLSTVEQYDEEIEALMNEASQIEDLLRGLNRSIDSYHSGLEMDHNSLEEIEQRLHTINTLKSKYGESLADILGILDQKTKELDYLEHYNENIEKIKGEISQFESDIVNLCGDISAMRQSAAIHISKEIQEILAELNFADSQVEVEVKQVDGFDASGYDQVTILISTNKNEPVQALNKIASGGELSRVMLALKSVFAKQDGVETLVFDEIDSGISGRTAQRVAEKKWLLCP